MTTLLGIAGALRRGSTNRLLIRAAAAAFGAAHFIEADLRLPLYDRDLEDAEGIPPAVRLLTDQIAAADAVVIATPEYNKSIPGVLKNALDWVSRVPGGVWRDKPVAIMSATDGRSGGERAQDALRLAILPFRPRLLPGPELLVAQSAREFDAEGRLTTPRYQDRLVELMADLHLAIR